MEDVNTTTSNIFPLNTSSITASTPQTGDSLSERNNQMTSVAHSQPTNSSNTYDASDYADDNAPCCRFCFEEDDEKNFIQPCLCDGSSKWVHRYVSFVVTIIESYIVSINVLIGLG